MDKDVAKMLKCRHRGRHYQWRWNWIVAGTKFGATHSLNLCDTQWQHRLLKDLRMEYDIPDIVERPARICADEKTPPRITTTQLRPCQK
jgi:hypothetical protein